MAYNRYFKVTTARFANVAFSNGSLPDGWIHRLQKKQPLAAPSDVKRYFVSPEESGQICMLACILGRGGEVFFPKLGEDQMLTFSAICDDFVKANGLEKEECASDAEAKQSASNLPFLFGEGTGKRLYPVVYFKSDTTGDLMPKQNKVLLISPSFLGRGRGRGSILSFTSKAIPLEKRPMRSSTCPARRSTWSGSRRSAW